MADFVKTMNDWRRMCQHMEKTGGDRSCDICPLGGCNAIYEDDVSTDYAEIGEKVAAWAAEHPEPVYPTWADYITMKMLEDITNRNDTTPQTLGTWMGKTNIPADIAQKLGIKPKEDKPKKRTKDMVCGNDYCELE